MRGQGAVLRASFPGRGAALLGRPRGSAAARPTFRRPSLLPPPQGPAGDGDPSGARGGLPVGPCRCPGCGARPCGLGGGSGRAWARRRAGLGLGLGREANGGARGACQPGVVVGGFSPFSLVARRSFAYF